MCPSFVGDDDRGEPMVVEQLHRLRLGQVGIQRTPLYEGAAAVILDENDTIVLMVSRSAGSGCDGDASTTPWTVVTVSGDIDDDTVPLLREALTQALDDRNPVLCDLTRVTYFGAAAAGLTLNMHMLAVASGQRFALHGASVMTERVLAIVDPHRILVRS
jgi:anti-anti-sigma factor